MTICQDKYIYSWVRPVGGGASTLQAAMPGKLKSPPLQAQVWGVHAGLTQLYSLLLKTHHTKNVDR